jgi:hypothetical protein
MLLFIRPSYLEIVMRKSRAVWSALVACGIGAAVMVAVSSCGSNTSAAAGDDSTPHVTGKSKEDIGRYITRMAGCHDCHTFGILQGKELKDIPESDWLTGSPLGFNGPWGTTYAPNLRMKVVPYTEQTFIAAMRKRNDKPPMAWQSLHAMTDGDLGAVFAYLKSLGISGVALPDAIPPGKDPVGPYIIMAPPMMGAGTAPASQPAK